MASKVIASVVSLVLVVGAVIGTVAVLKHNSNDKEEQSNTSTTMKAVTSFCAPTPYKDACALSVEEVAKNSSATPKDYIEAVFNATLSEVKKALGVAQGINVDQKVDNYHYMAVQDCKDLLEDAVDELQASYSMVGDSELHTLHDRVDELLNWLSAVYAYQTTCLDQVEKPEYKSALENGMANATQLTNNAINIVAEMTEVFKAFNVDLSSLNLTSTTSSASRRLLDVHQMGHDGFPSWFPAADRKLLAAVRGRGGHHRPAGIAPNAVVAKDGSGKFKTIQAAVNAYPPNFRGRYTIYVKAGIYEEKVIVDKKKPNVFIFGDGPGKTIVTGHLNTKLMGVPTTDTATFAAIAPGFIARGMTFQNTAGPEGHQAVALRVQSDMSAVFDCSIEGFQDTLYYHTHRQFYRNCVIMGTVDYIFGMGSAVIQNSLLVVRRGSPSQFNAITADGKEVQKLNTGVVLQNCRIVPGRDLEPVKFKVATFLGRPWKKFAKTVIMQTEIADFVRPEGFTKFDDTKGERTAEYLEWANKGPGSLHKRNPEFLRSRKIAAKEAFLYTPGVFLQGNMWLRFTGAPFDLGFTR